MAFLLVGLVAGVAAASHAGEVGPTSRAQMTIHLHLTPHINVTEVEGRDEAAFEVCMEDADFVGRIVASTRVLIADDCATTHTIETTAPSDERLATLTVVPE